MKSIQAESSIPPEEQLNTHNTIFSRVEQEVISGVTPVVEVDLDLAALKPISRTVKALYATGDTYNIKEFLEPDSNFELLPGFNKSAWINFLVINRLPEKYPELRWIGPGNSQGNDQNVFSTFVHNYWTKAWLREDTVTEGLVRWVKKIENLGGKVVFLANRPLPEHIEPAEIILTEAGIENLNLIKESHAKNDPLRQAELKANSQLIIKKKYGKPVAIIDHESISREDIIIANDNKDIIGVEIALREFIGNSGDVATRYRITDFRI